MQRFIKQDSTDTDPLKAWLDAELNVSAFTAYRAKQRTVTPGYAIDFCHEKYPASVTLSSNLEKECLDDGLLTARIPSDPSVEYVVRMQEQKPRQIGSTSFSQPYVH